MKAYSSLLLCALVLAAAVLPQAAQAQNYCFTVDGQSLAVAFDFDARRAELHASEERLFARLLEARRDALAETGAGA